MIVQKRRDGFPDPVGNGGELTHEEDGSTDMAAWFHLSEIAGLDRVSVVDVGLRMAGLILR